MIQDVFMTAVEFLWPHDNSPRTIIGNSPPSRWAVCCPSLLTIVGTQSLGCVSRLWQPVISSITTAFHTTHCPQHVPRAAVSLTECWHPLMSDSHPTTHTSSLCQWLTALWAVSYWHKLESQHQIWQLAWLFPISITRPVSLKSQGIFFKNCIVSSG